MVSKSIGAIFSIEDIQQSAWDILELEPDSILAFRLLREVLQVPPDDPTLLMLKNTVVRSKWVRQLEESQQPDGSWGRFHSQDTKKKTIFHTTEEAIDRAFALGQDSDTGMLIKARQHILDVLNGDARISDRDEKSESWPLLIRLILTGRLAQIDPTSLELDPFWSYLAEVIEQAFTSGSYHLEDEEAAYLQISRVHAPGGFLESQHALWILSSRRLPDLLDRALVNWIWHKQNGIRYLRVPLIDPPPRRIGYWFRSMNILSRFISWREVSVGLLNQLWIQRNDQGLWDFGSQIARSVDFPLSNSWRQSINRRLDYSTCSLILLRKYFD
jgi:hypothetical protein